MMSSEEIYYTIALTRMTGFNQQIALLLYQTLGSSQAVYEHRNHIGDAVPETTPQLRESLKHWDDALRRRVLTLLSYYIIEVRQISTNSASSIS